MADNSTVEMKLKTTKFCHILSVDGSHPPIDLEDRKPIIIGRGPLTKITSKKCSRKQVEVTANYFLEEVTVKQLGTNPSKVGSEILNPEEKCVLGAGGTFQLVVQHTHSIFFGQKLNKRSFDSLNSEKQRPEEVECDWSVEGCTKRIKLDHACSLMPDHESRSKPSMKPLESFFKSDSVPPAEKIINEWEEHGTMLLFRYGFQTQSTKIAAFDLDSTLIETASGKRFPTGPDDWKIMSSVVKTLKSLVEKGFRIVIFTNQVGMLKGKPKKEDFKKKLECIAKRLSVPILVLISIGNDVYRKPCCGMWEYLVDKENAGVKPDLSCSIYVGDAAGRLAGWKTGAKKDFSASDRKFANNIGLQFATPEEYFLGHPKCDVFSLQGFDPHSIDFTLQQPEYDPPSARPVSECTEMVVFVGFPAAGKTTYYETFMKSAGYSHVNRDSLGSWQKCVTLCDKLLHEGRSVVIDNTNPDAASRARYIECAKKHHIPVRCFHFTASRDQAKHNNKFRELTLPSVKTSKINDIVFNVFVSKFVEPTTHEGFTEIVKVKVCPTFEDEKLKSLYEQFLT